MGAALAVAIAVLAGGAAIWAIAGQGSAEDPERDDEPRIAGPVRATELERRTIYRSPERPGYTAWVGAWTAPDSSLMTAFTQVTGPVPSPPSRDWTRFDLSAIYLRSPDGGVTWEPVRTDEVRGPPHAYTGQPTIGLRDGTLLRRVNGEDLEGFAGGPRTAYLERLEPGAEEWSGRVILLEPDRFTYNVSRIQYLSDGRLLASGNYWEVPAGERLAAEPVPLDRQGWLLMVSDDEGRTWSDALTVPEGHAPPPNEWDLAELPSGDLLAVMRTYEEQDRGTQLRRQALLRREGGGWMMEPAERAPFPHSGHPELLVTQEGVVLHIATSGVHYTADEGRSWRPLRFADPRMETEYRSGYYPRSLQSEDGTIHVFSHSGGDDAYGAHDQAIILDRFRLAPAERPAGRR